jgi:predicted PurR-regulated permease PerM
VVLITILLLALAYLVWRGAQVLLQAFAGVLFAIFLITLSNWVRERSGLRHGWSLTIVLAALVALAGGVGWLLANHLAVQISELTVKLPQSLEQLGKYLEQFPWGRFLLEQLPQIPETLTQGGQFGQLMGVLMGGANILVTAVVILFVGIFGAAEPSLYRQGLVHVVPHIYRPRMEEAMDAVLFNMRWWLVGQVFLMLAVGITTSFGLWLLGVPLALTLGIIAGILELIPFLGAWLSAIPAVLMALLISPWHVLWVGLLFLGIHIVEGYILVPLVQKRTVEMPPALTLVAQVLLGNLFGLMGLFVAAPLTVTLVVLLKMLYVEDTLGDEEVVVPGEPGTPERREARAS